MNKSILTLGITAFFYSCILFLASCTQTPIIPDEPKSDIYIYPNPCRDIFKIDINSSVTTTIDVFSDSGSLIQTFRGLPSGLSNVTVDLKSQKRGVYYVVITQDGKSITKKVIKA